MKIGHRAPPGGGRSAYAGTGAPLWRLLPMLALLTVTACGGGRSYSGQDPFGGDTPTPQVRIRVQNLNFYDARLAAIGDGGLRRLGTVGGNQNATFTIPWAFPTGMRIEIDLLAGPRCTTETIVVEPGAQVELQIPANFDSFTLCRRVP